MDGMQLKADGDNITRAGFVDYYADINFCVPSERENVLFFDKLSFSYSYLKALGKLRIALTM